MPAPQFFSKTLSNGSVWFRAEHDILRLITYCIKYRLLVVINNVANIQLIIYKALFLHQCRLLTQLLRFDV